MFTTYLVHITNSINHTIMAGKRRNNRRNRRRRSNRSKFSSILRNVSTGLRGIRSTRSITFAPPTIDSAGKITDSWIKKAFPYLSVVMKFIGILLADSHLGVGSKTVRVAATIQSILIGADDILYDHPITTPVTVGADDQAMEAMTIDYSLVRVTEVKIVISLMGKVSERAGRLAACLIPLTYQKALDLNDPNSASRTGEVVDFKQLTQKPGAIVSPNLRPITIVRRTTGFCASQVELGTNYGRNTNLGYTHGGLPLYELIVGYQDLASLTSSPDTAYSLEEAVICVEISGSVQLDAPVSTPRYMRSAVRQVYNVSNITVTEPGSRTKIELPHSSLRLQNGVLHVLPELEEVERDFEKL